MIKKLLAIAGFNFLMIIIFVAGMLCALSWFSNQQQKRIESPVPYPTGYEVFNELNKYRESLGLPDFVLYQPLCNNIAERWQHYEKYNNHDGFNEFVATYMPGMSVSEILSPGITAQETVKNWISSPSHDTFIRNNSKACVYSSDGLSVALLSN